MKNLANCKPSEFLAQSFKIKKSVQEWLDVTELLEVRKKQPENLIKVDGLSGEARTKAIAENKKKLQEQVKKNLGEILDRMLDTNAEKTLEVLALCCFVDPREVDEHPMSEYLESLGELISDKGVLSFFTSLAQLEQTNIGIVSKQ